MEWLNRMTNAIQYIEEHIDGELKSEDIAKIACSSTFHFQRMFLMLTDMTLAEYIRKRRLTLAAQELAMTDARVLDIALKYGYDSPESFAKAFRKAHGITPSAARQPGATLKAFPRLSFHFSLRGDQDMDYRIEQKEAFSVLGKKLRVTSIDGENLKAIPAFWNEMNSNGMSDRLCELSPESSMYGICMHMDMDTRFFDYMIAVDTPAACADELKPFDTEEIPAATWAIFTSVGPMPDAVQKTWQRVFQEWLPATGYEHTGGPELEVYLPGDPAAADYRCEVWIPVMKK
ncbi:AraC family transcriptional regulator [Paenibacillus sp. 1001270B_150601_E10]|uniref:AraC family transcriptional regulator n=1 Tax=Paenibacillus sp. 1001270B_150601_E10 TaxID=2787079 RepID=UPI00189FB3BE|nr:AraC family transcriptional regulator [Paenibacillus sp. 1001270B_150601_E10]